MISDRGPHTAVWPHEAMNGLMEAPGFEVRHFIGHCDMFIVG